MKNNATFSVMLLAKARAEEMHDFSDAEIQRVFGHTVTPDKCIAAFRSLVDAGLQPDDLNKDFDTLVEQVINLRPVFYNPSLTPNSPNFRRIVMSRKMQFCSKCGTPAPANPKRAGWVVRGHGNLVCPECRLSEALKATNRGGSLGFVKHYHELFTQLNDSISASGCQEFSDDFIAIAEHQFAEGARRVRFV